MFRLRERPGDATVLVGARNDEKANQLAEVQESSWVTASKNRTERDARNRPLANQTATHQNGLPFLGVGHNGIEAP